MQEHYVTVLLKPFHHWPSDYSIVSSPSLETTSLSLSFSFSRPSGNSQWKLSFASWFSLWMNSLSFLLSLSNHCVSQLHHSRVGTQAYHLVHAEFVVAANHSINNDLQSVGAGEPRREGRCTAASVAEAGWHKRVRSVSWSLVYHWNQR